MTATNTVIVGSGVIGLSIAFYLSESPRTQAQSIHLVDSADELFNCASGYAGGFLSSDWYTPSLESLGELSFRLHKELAAKYNGRENWGYSPSTSTSLAPISSHDDDESKTDLDWLMDGYSRANASVGTHDLRPEDQPAWLNRREDESLTVVSHGDTTAQVDPKKLCEFLLERCEERGVVVHHPAKVVSVSKDARDELAGVRIEEKGVESDLPCTRLVVASGPWTPRVFSALFPSSSATIPIIPLAGHSIVVRTPRWLTAMPKSTNTTHAVFTTSASEGFAPEMFSRVNGEIYLAGLNSTQIPLPGVAGGAALQKVSIEQLRRVAKQLFGSQAGGGGEDDDDDDVEVVREALCFRPATERGTPVLGRVPDEVLGDGLKTRSGGEGGVFVAAGHGPWGISLSLGTGKAVSELIEGVETSADLSACAL